MDVSADGSVVVGWRGDENRAKTSAFRWTALEGIVPLGDLAGGGPSLNAFGVSPSGSFIAGYGQSTAGSEAFLWSAYMGVMALGSPPGVACETRAVDVSDRGLVVGSCYGDGVNGAFVWDEAHGPRMLQEALGADFGVDVEGWGLRFAAAVVSDDASHAIVGSGTNPDGADVGWLVVVPLAAPEPHTAVQCAFAALILMWKDRRRVRG